MVSGMSVKPLKGDAVLFWSMVSKHFKLSKVKRCMQCNETKNFCMQGLDGQPDPRSVHGGCEVLSGQKWSATKWMRQKAI